MLQKLVEVRILSPHKKSFTRLTANPLMDLFFILLLSQNILKYLKIYEYSLVFIKILI